MVTKYQKRISGPMLDRMDIHIEVPRVDYEKLSSDRLGESSADIRARVESARERQRTRFGLRSLPTSDKQSRETLQSAIICNSDMRVAEVRQPKVQIGRDQRKSRARGDIVLRMSQLQLSARAYHRILKLARTIADLAGSDAIHSVYLAEALQHRPKILVS